MQQPVTIGMDLGCGNSRYCMLSNQGEILPEGRVATTKTDFINVPFDGPAAVLMRTACGAASTRMRRIICAAIAKNGMR